MKLGCNGGTERQRLKLRCVRMGLQQRADWQAGRWKLEELGEATTRIESSRGGATGVGWEGARHTARERTVGRVLLIILGLLECLVSTPVRPSRNKSR